MSTTLFQEVQSLNENYSKNAESIEGANREALRAEREKACAEALQVITAGVEDRIKAVACSGRKVRGQYLPRTECCIYRWARDDAPDLKESEGNQQNKFCEGKYYLNDLLRRQGLIHRLQDWFDTTHQCEPVEAEAAQSEDAPSEAQGKDAEVAPEATTEPAEAEAAAEPAVEAGDDDDDGTVQGEDNEGDEEDGETTRRGPRPVPPTRAFKVYWNPMRHQEGRFGIFVNWDRSDWERVDRRLRNPPKPTAKNEKPATPQAANKRQQEPAGANGRRNNRRRDEGNRETNSARGQDRRPAGTQRAGPQSQRDAPSRAGPPRRLPPRRPQDQQGRQQRYAEQNTNSDGVAHSFRPSL